MAVVDRLLNPAQQNDLLLFRLYRISATAAANLLRPCIGPHGLTRREWRVLSFVAENQGVLSSELAERSLLDRACTSRALTGLAAKGLIDRRPRSSNRREVMIFLTEQGHAMYGRMFPKLAAINAGLVAQFSREERAVLDRLLTQIQERVDASASSKQVRI